MKSTLYYFADCIFDPNRFRLVRAGRMIETGPNEVVAPPQPATAAQSTGGGALLAELA
jgi:hypothetical protein